jgi:hypothetical protein
MRLLLWATLAALLVAPAAHIRGAEDRADPAQVRRMMERHWAVERRIQETSPHRRDTPARYLNITDDEVREIQVAVAEVLSDSLVNIGTVVTGCPHEEGPACSDQVYVVAYRPDRSVGVLLSKVNNQWGIGVIQRWWLCRQKLASRKREFPSLAEWMKAMDALVDNFPSCATLAATDVPPAQ